MSKAVETIEKDAEAVVKKVESEIKIAYEFTVDEVNKILAGLGELPAKFSHDLINNVKTKAEATVSATQAPAPQVLNEGK